MMKWACKISVFKDNRGLLHGLIVVGQKKVLLVDWKLNGNEQLSNLQDK